VVARAVVVGVGGDRRQQLGRVGAGLRCVAAIEPRRARGAASTSRGASCGARVARSFAAVSARSAR
jgi:hypothetical protein